MKIFLYMTGITNTLGLCEPVNSATAISASDTVLAVTAGVQVIHADGVTVSVQLSPSY